MVYSYAEESLDNIIEVNETPSLEAGRASKLSNASCKGKRTIEGPSTNYVTLFLTSSPLPEPKNTT